MWQPHLDVFMFPTSDVKPPAVLSVCYESRQEGLRSYKLMFKDINPNKGGNRVHHRWIYINLKKDLLIPLFHADATNALDGKGGWPNTQRHLAMDLDTFGWMVKDYDWPQKGDVYYSERASNQPGPAPTHRRLRPSRRKSMARTRKSGPVKPISLIRTIALFEPIVLCGPGRDDSIETVYPFQCALLTWGAHELLDSLIVNGRLKDKSEDCTPNELVILDRTRPYMEYFKHLNEYSYAFEYWWNKLHNGRCNGPAIVHVTPDWDEEPPWTLDEWPYEQDWWEEHYSCKECVPIGSQPYSSWAKYVRAFRAS